jgi:hypothetical protein
MTSPHTDRLIHSDRDEAVLSSLPMGVRAQIEAMVETAVGQIPCPVSIERLQLIADLADERGRALEARGDELGSLTGYAIAAALRRLASQIRRLH